MTQKDASGSMLYTELMLAARAFGLRGTDIRMGADPNSDAYRVTLTNCPGVRISGQEVLQAVGLSVLAWDKIKELAAQAAALECNHATTDDRSSDL